jgi:hypothetical protein
MAKDVFNDVLQGWLRMCSRNVVKGVLKHVALE